MAQRFSIFVLSMVLLAAVAARPKAAEVSGDLGGVLSPELNPVYVTGPSRVPSGAYLLVEPGVQIRFLPGAGLSVDGVLIVQGSVGHPVFIEPAGEGYWDSISVNTGGEAVLVQCVVRGGGMAATTPNGMLRVNGGSLSLFACDISASQSNGVYVSEGRLATATCRYHSNGGAFPTDAAVHVVTGDIRFATGLSRNSIANTTTFGVYNDGVEPVRALDTWWGAVSGPQHMDNLDGLGSPVSDDVLFGGYAVLSPFPFPGDVDGDGQIMWPDVLECARIAGGLVEPNLGAATAADVVPDGEVNVMDVTRLLRVVNGLEAL